MYRKIAKIKENGHQKKKTMETKKVWRKKCLLENKTPKCQ